MKDLRLALMTAIDIPIPECKLILHQPRIEEIAFLGDTEFYSGIQTICLYKSMFTQDNIDLSAINNFQIFMMVMSEKETADKKKAVKEVLQILFPKYNFIFTPMSLIFQEGEEQIIIDGDNFEALQKAIREVCCLNNGPMDQTAFNPANEAAREIARKLMRGRERVAAQKNNSGSSVFVQYLSILSIATGLSINELKEYTIFQFYDTIERYSLWLNWDLDIRTRLAGGKPDSHPDNWMKNIH